MTKKLKLNRFEAAAYNLILWGVLLFCFFKCVQPQHSHIDLDHQREHQQLKESLDALIEAIQRVGFTMEQNHCVMSYLPDGDQGYTHPVRIIE